MAGATWELIVPRFQVSLRGLLAVTALIAVAIVLVVNYPLLTAMFLLFIGPTLVRASATPYVRRWTTRHVHWIVAVLQATYIFACCFFLFLAPLARDWRPYAWLAVLSGVAVVCACLAWAQSHAVGASNRVERIETAPDQVAIGDSPGRDGRAM